MNCKFPLTKSLRSSNVSACSRSVLHKETMVLYFKNVVEHANKLRGENADFLMLHLALRILSNSH